MCSTNWSPPLPKDTLGKFLTRKDVWINLLLNIEPVSQFIMFANFLFNIEYS